MGSHELCFILGEIVFGSSGEQGELDCGFKFREFIVYAILDDFTQILGRDIVQIDDLLL